MTSTLTETQLTGQQSSQEYRQLRVWQRAMELSRRVLSIFEKNSKLPEALRQSIIETALQVPASIAAGYSRGSQAEFIRFMNITKGDLAALDTFCMLSHQLSFLELSARRQIEILIIETNRLIEQTTEKWQDLH